MSKIVRMSADTPLDKESIRQLQELARMPASEIRTDLIPERRFDLTLAAQRRRIGWKPGQASQKKAS